MIVTLARLRQTNRNEQDRGVTVGNHYYATLGHANADVVPLVQQFDNRLRRDQWVQNSRLAGSDIEVRPVTARQADSLTRRLVHRLDRYLLQAPEYEPLSDMKDEYYLRRNPFCHHDGNYDAPLSTVNGSYRPYLQWRESNTWEHEVWYWWVPLASAADRMLAEKFRNHLSELHSRGGLSGYSTHDCGNQMVHHPRSQSHGRDRGLTKLVPSLLAFRHERQYSPPLEQGD